jgi:DNA-binding transcriptional LysR family regulator
LRGRAIEAKLLCVSANPRNPNLRWDDLRLLLAAARSGSLLAGGRGLGVATSTLSRGLARLEAAVGTRLLERRSDGVRLTPAGTRLCETAEALELELGARVRELPAGGREIAGTIRISAGDLFTELLAETIARFIERHPAVSVELAIEPRAVDVARREADLALRTGPVRDLSLVDQTLGELSYGLYAADAYLQRHGVPRSIGALAKHRFVGFGPPLSDVPSMRWLRRQGAKHFPVRVTTVGGLVAATRAGAGIAALQDRFADGLERVLPRTRPDPMTVHLVAHRDVRRLPHVRAFADALRERFREEPTRKRRAFPTSS